MVVDGLVCVHNSRARQCGQKVIFEDSLVMKVNHIHSTELTSNKNHKMKGNDPTCVQINLFNFTFLSQKVN